MKKWRYGDPLISKRAPVQRGPFEKRFWKFVHKSPDGCWLWTGHLNNKGYGDAGHWGDKHMLAHRASWKLHHGDLSDDINVLHSCDVPNCVNPAHLFTGTQKENMVDCKIKGRTTAGIKNAQARLLDDDIRSIRKMHQAGSPQPHLARQYGITQSAVSLITSRKRWAHIA